MLTTITINIVQTKTILKTKKIVTRLLCLVISNKSPFYDIFLRLILNYKITPQPPNPTVPNQPYIPTQL